MPNAPLEIEVRFEVQTSAIQCILKESVRLSAGSPASSQKPFFAIPRPSKDRREIDPDGQIERRGVRDESLQFSSIRTEYPISDWGFEIERGGVRRRPNGMQQRVETSGMVRRVDLCQGNDALKFRFNVVFARVCEAFEEGIASYRRVK
jgi:hypothetical protein